MDRTDGGGSRAMSDRKQKIISIMRYVTFVLIILFVVLLLLFTSGSNKPFEDIKRSVESVLDTTNLKKQDSSDLKRKMGLNEADYAGVMYYSSEFSISAEEVLLVKVKKNAQVSEVLDAIENRIESRKEDFEGYAPEVIQLLDDSKQSVRGKYILYVCAPKADEYMAAFNKSL